MRRRQGTIAAGRPGRCGVTRDRLLVGTVALLLSAPALAQQFNPVYTDDSPVAGETLAQVRQFIASKDDSEAARELQKLLDEQPDRVVAVEGQPELFVGVRA